MTMFSMRVAGFVLAGCLLSAVAGRAATETMVYAFQGGPDGEFPNADLITAGGILYGTTTQGGGYDGTSCSSGCGTVFSVTIAGKEKIVYSFKDGDDGALPYSGLTNLHGIFFGTTPLGGHAGGGTVYSVTRTGAEKVLASFPTVEGPWGGLIHVDGVLYGTTATGGNGGCHLGHGCGSVFSLTSSGTLMLLYVFDGKDGFLPYARLHNVGGTLYGTTLEGGGNSCGAHIACGTVYSVTLGGTGKHVYSFRGGSDGDGPDTDLIDMHGILYGTTSSGGGAGCDGYGCGTVFSVTKAGAEKIVYSFQAGGDGAHPQAGLINVGGTLYGTTIAGGTGSCNINGNTGCGTVFSVTPAGMETVIYSFQGGSDGADPQAGLVDLDGTLYGTTQFGGSTGCGGNGCGTVFAIAP